MHQQVVLPGEPMLYVHFHLPTLHFNTYETTCVWLRIQICCSLLFHVEKKVETMFMQPSLALSSYGRDIFILFCLVFRLAELAKVKNVYHCYDAVVMCTLLQLKSSTSWI